MKRAALPLLLSLCLLLGAAPAWAQSKGGGRSYSSGGGRSYSSGGKSSPSGGGRSSPSGGSKPGGGGKSYSGGSKSSPPGDASRPVTPSGGGKSYGSGGSDSYTSSSRKPSGGSYDTDAARAQKQAESRSNYAKSNAPRPSYTDPRGEVHRLDPKDREIDNLRQKLDRERWINRTERQRDFYGPYLGRPVIVYNDPYNGLFWYWLLAQSVQNQAYWAYHHHDVMDRARYEALLATNADLRRRVEELEEKKEARDPSYTPQGIDTDLMYSDGYVDAVYNPQPAGVTFGKVLFWIFLVLLIAGLAWFAVWLVFIKRWDL